MEMGLEGTGGDTPAAVLARHLYAHNPNDVSDSVDARRIEDCGELASCGVQRLVQLVGAVRWINDAEMHESHPVYPEFSPFLKGADNLFLFACVSSLPEALTETTRLGFECDRIANGGWPLNPSFASCSEDGRIEMISSRSIGMFASCVRKEVAELATREIEGQRAGENVDITARAFAEDLGAGQLERAPPAPCQLKARE